jgi:tetratricopeptide (TPR) repeat protein
MYPLATRPAPKIWQILGISLSVAVVLLIAYMVVKPAETPFTRAVALIRANKAAAALPILEDLSKKEPENSAVLPWLAQGYLLTERLGEGRTALDTALKLKLPGATLVPVVLAYADYYESKNDFEEAEKLFDSAAAACAGSDLNGGRAQLYLKWGERNAEDGDLGAAVEHLEKANLLVADVPEPVRSQIPSRLAQYYREMAALAETKAKKDDEAIALLEKSLRVSDEPATRMALAAIYTRHKDWDKAIENYTLVSQADENNLEARHRLIDILLSKKDYPHAQEALMELIDKEKSIENYEMLVAVDLKMQNYAGAVKALEDAIGLREKDPVLLVQLEKTLRDWSASLAKQGKPDEAMSVRGHAERVAEMITELTKKEEVAKEELPVDNAASTSEPPPWPPGKAPIALTSSRIWLSRGSLTPEGEIQIKNITGRPVDDLSLTVVFYDNTAKTGTGTVVLPVASQSSPPFEANAAKSLYFSCPNIVKADHQLAVVIFWKGRFLKELPVVKVN